MKRGLGAFVGLAALTVAVPEAPAAVKCRAAGSALSLTLDAADDRVIIERRSGGRLMFSIDGAKTFGACGRATVRNVDLVRVRTGAGTQHVTLSLRGGTFAPGKTAEKQGVSEIEFALDLGEEDFLTLSGGDRGATLVAGRGGVEWNRDGDRDVALLREPRSIRLFGGNGPDVLSAGGSRDTGPPLTRQASLSGYHGRDRITGGAGDDWIDDYPNKAVEGLGPADNAGVIQGGDGDDRIRAGTGPQNIAGDAGSDRIWPDWGKAAIGADVVQGGTGDDFMETEGDGDYASTVAPADHAGDRFAGGDGSDIVYYLYRTAPVIVTLDGVANDGHDDNGDGRPDEGDDVGVDVEAVMGSLFDDRIDASAAPVSVERRTLIGSGGNDVLVGSAGHDSLTGGPGNDLLRGLDGNDLLGGEDGNDFGTPGGNDTLFGGSGNDILRGEGGDDTLDGGPDTDQFRGSFGADVFTAQDGVAETVDGGAGDNAVDTGTFDESDTRTNFP